LTWECASLSPPSPFLRAHCCLGGSSGRPLSHHPTQFLPVAAPPCTRERERGTGQAQQLSSTAVDLCVCSCHHHAHRVCGGGGGGARACVWCRYVESLADFTKSMDQDQVCSLSLSLSLSRSHIIRLAGCASLGARARAYAHTRRHDRRALAQIDGDSAVGEAHYQSRMGEHMLWIGRATYFLEEDSDAAAKCVRLAKAGRPAAAVMALAAAECGCVCVRRV
jgi:hypothetical protein